MGTSWAIAVHGGAGQAHPDEDPRAVQAGILAAGRVGARVLEQGGAALDAVEAAVVALEDDPLFNAGTGAVLTSDGTVELDASIMGADGPRAGAVAAVRGVKNPVKLARRVLEATPHLLLAGPGAEVFAREQGFVPVEPATLVTPRALARWAKAKEAAAAQGSGGTVGAVAVDARGGLASATSTGGTLLKRPGRVGDTPILGAGTWAAAGAGAASCTGAGEKILLAGLARFAVEALGQGQAPDAACVQALGRLAALGGSGGLILVDAQGHLAAAFDTPRMAHALLRAGGSEQVGFLPP